MSKLNKTTLFLILFIVAKIWLVSLFFTAAQWPAEIQTTTKLWVFSRLISDSLLIAAICLLLYRRKWLFRIAAYALAFVSLSAYYIQYQSVRFAESYLPAVAVENSQHINLIETEPIIFGGISLLAFVFIAGVTLSRARGFAPLRVQFTMIAILLVSVGLLRNDYKWLPKEVQAERLQIYRTTELSYAKKSPTSELVAVLSNEFQVRGRLADTVGDLNSELREFAIKHNIEWGAKGDRYPLTKVTNTGPLDGLTVDAPIALPNIIVIYAEGVSARTIQPYSSKFPGISPNIEDFSSKAIRINNYFNHTFATYRGLSGQHCSMFPTSRTEENTSYYCLSHILNKTGYHTSFMFSQWKNNTYIDEMLYKIGFQEVLAYDDLSNTPPLRDDTPDNSYRMSDDRLFSALINKLQNAEKQGVNTATKRQPFYLGLYNFETHTGVRLQDKSVLYKAVDKDDKSYILDSIHNLDKSFGKFWSYFKNSSYYDNTIVIFTADHAHFPDKHYNSFWGKREAYSRTFMDKIPLLIYSPIHRKVSDFELAESSSLDLAPSILHLIGVNRYENAFLGHSIFDPKFRMRPVAMSNSKLWYLYGGVPVELSEEQTNKNYGRMQQIIRKMQALETQNRLWPEAKTEAVAN